MVLVLAAALKAVNTAHYAYYLLLVIGMLIRSLALWESGAV